MTTTEPDRLPTVLIHMLKGIVEREVTPDTWLLLVEQRSHVREYFARIGLDLVVDDTEGHAYLRQSPTEDGAAELPRLVPRRQLSYPVSLMLALLRKRLAEHDASSGDVRLILTAADITDLVRLFQADTGNEAKLEDRVQRDIGTVVKLGFLRRLKGQDDAYEVRRILRAFVDAQWLSELNQQLEMYAAYGIGQSVSALSPGSETVEQP